MREIFVDFPSGILCLEGGDQSHFRVERFVEPKEVHLIYTTPITVYEATKTR